MSTVVVHNFGEEGQLEHFLAAVEAMKQLPTAQLSAFLVTLVKRAQGEMCFKDYPFPNVVAMGFVLDHFKRGAP